MKLPDLLAAGDPLFLGHLAALTDPARLHALARRWYPGAGPGTRRLLLAYLDGPLHPFHEPLLVRLLRAAARAGDDEVMAAFLVLFDRALRRRPRRARPGFVMQPTGMPRRLAAGAYVARTAVGEVLMCLNERQQRDYAAYRLFAVPTRLLWQRRAWRYFDRLGREGSPRYAAGLALALARYTDEDTADTTLPDNGGLMHALFEHSDSVRRCRGRWVWRIPSWAPRRAPAHDGLWLDRPEVLFELMVDAASAFVRRWAGHLLRELSYLALARLPVARLLAELVRPDLERASLAADVLRARGGLEAVPVDRWLGLLLSTERLPRVVEDLAFAQLGQRALTTTQAVSLVCSASPPVAERAWVQFLAPGLSEETIAADDLPLLLPLLAATDQRLRPRMAEELAFALHQRWPDRADLLWRFLEHRHGDVRTAGLVQLQRGWAPGGEVAVWRRLAVSTHDDVRRWWRDHLDRAQRGAPRALRDALPLDEGAVRVLWARVLLTLHGPWRTRRLLAEQLVARVAWRPDDAEYIVPMLAAILEHSKGPAWRTALAGLVRLVEALPEWTPLVTSELPQLHLATPEPAGSLG
jgi:hypothetical protein